MTQSQLEIVKKVFGGIPYTFHRKEGFYCLVLQSDEEAEANGISNPGTLQIINELSEQVVFCEV